METVEVWANLPKSYGDWSEIQNSLTENHCSENKLRTNMVAMKTAY